MKSIMRAAIVGLLILPLPGVNSQAQSRSTQIEALKKQMEEIQKQNQQQIEELRKKIEELEAGKEADQKKIEEIATKKEEEDKDAWWKEIKVEYKKPGDGFTLKTADENFKMKIKLRSQFQFSINDTDEENTATDFRIRRLRLYFEGNAFRPWLLYSIQASADGGNFELRDAYFDFAYPTTYGQVFVPRVGQYKVPFNREELNSSSELQLVERSIVNEEFSFARDRGAAIYGVLGNYITYGAGVFNGDGRNGRSVDSNLLYAGRIMFTPCCGELKYANSSFPAGGDYKIEPNFGEDKPLIAIGVSALGIPGLHIDRKTPDNDIDERFAEIGTVDADVFSASADINFKYSVFSMEGELDYRRISPDESGLPKANDYGVRAQAGVFLIPRFIEVAARYAQIWYDTDVEGRDTKWELTPGLNFYLSKSHKYKIQLSYSFIRNEFTDSQDIDENIFRTQFQVYF